MFPVYATDRNGTPHVVAAPVTVTLTSSPTSGVTFSSTTVTIPAGSYFVDDTVTFTAPGIYTVTAGYLSGGATSTASGSLVTMVAPTTFSPGNVTISLGQAVTWKNTDAINHTTTSTGLWDSGVLAPLRPSRITSPRGVPTPTTARSTGRP